jgi:cysteine desulfurase family protein (TIGR01976 family)
MPLDLAKIRARFPALNASDAAGPYRYFDNPAGTQVPDSVASRMSECLLRANANIGGYFTTSRRAGEIVDEARRAMADFINAPSPDEIIFGQNMTSLTLHLSRSIGRHLQAGDEIILSKMDHDANVEPWSLMARDHGLRIRWLPFDVRSFEFDLAQFDALLSSRTKLVCIAAASNLTGTVNDIDALCRRAREAGAWTYIDAVQSAPHVLTDVQKSACDFLVCSAYKFFGPHQGILWGRRELLQEIEPYKVRPAPDALPWCFEPGTQSHEGIAGTAAAVDYLAWIGGELSDGVPPDAGRRAQLVAAFGLIDAHERLLAERLIDGLRSLPGVTVQGITDPAALQRRVPTVSFTHEQQSPAAIAEALATRNIFVWSGHNYAVEAARMLGILESGGAVRIGAVHYNDLAEIDFVLGALGEILD